MKTFVYTATDVQGNTVKNARMTAEDVNDFLEKIHERVCSAPAIRRQNPKSQIRFISSKLKSCPITAVSSALCLLRVLRL